MRRDMELIRRIALTLEERPGGFRPAEVKFEGFSPEEVGYHAYLMLQGKLAEGADVTALGVGPRQAILTGLTWDGHEFLDAARDESRWKKAMVLVQEKGGAVTLSVLTEILNSLMRGRFGL
jgi:hypothetical protein